MHNKAQSDTEMSVFQISCNEGSTVKLLKELSMKAKDTAY